MPADSIFKQCFYGYLNLGYSPLARFENSWPKAWSDYCQSPAPMALLRQWAKRPDAMIAFACGFKGLVAIDVDTDDPIIKAAVLKALPQCRIARYGSKGFALLARYQGAGECRFTHIYTGEGASKRPLVEIKGMGQNITVPPSLHSKTGREYEWLNPESGIVTYERPAFADLPAIDDGDIARLRQAMEPWASKPRPAAPPRPDFDPNKIPKSRYEAWYRAGLRNAQSALSGAREGRPSLLFRSVCSLGAAVHHRIIPKSEFEAAFLDACDVNGLASRDGRHAILASIDSGLRFAIDDGLPDLGEPAAGKSAKRKAKPNGSGGAESETCEGRANQGDQAPKGLGNGLDRDPDLAKDNRPIIEVHGGSNSKNASEAEAILFKAKAPIYHQAGALVAPTRCSLVDNRGDTVHVPAIKRISATGIQDALGIYARWQKWDGRAKREVAINPPPNIAQIIFDRGGQGEYWRVLAGVTSSPVLRHDGTIATAPGYDEMSCWYLQDLPRMPPIPPHPDEHDARKALEVLKPLLEEFPFIDSEHPDRTIPQETASYSVALSALLTLPARPMMNIAPGHAARANEAGTGKTYLFNIAAAIGLGTKCPIITQGSEREETEKRLSAQMIKGSQILCIDNINGDLQNDLIGVVISEDQVDVRILGRSENAKLTNRFVVFVTGNNLRIVGDLNRRMLICEMDAQLEHPSERLFDHDPVGMVLKDRGRYLAAALTIIRAHALESFPGFADLSPLVQFEQWSKVVRGAIVWLGFRDPVESMETLKKADPQRSEQSAFVFSMAELFEPGYAKPVTAREIVEESTQICEDGRDDARKCLAEILSEFKDRSGKVSAIRLGKWLARFQGRRFGGFRLSEIKAAPRSKYYVEKLP